jgi:SAM-dependent methyltransferase
MARVKWRLRRLASAEHRAFDAARGRLADRYLRGEGLEIGALHMPLAVPRGAAVRYVDRMATPDLRVHYPELARLALVDVDVIDDGETLATVPDGSQDFVIANHFLEHTQDPVGTLRHHVRVLREGGVLYLAIPDKRETFDADRPVTTLEHVLLDHVEGPARSRRTHFEEWARHVAFRGTDAADEQVLAEADRLDALDYSIHFHVWTPDALAELLVHLRTELGLPIELEAMERNGHEFIVVLRRAARPASRTALYPVPELRLAA